MNNNDTTTNIVKLVVTVAVLFNYGFWAAIATLIVLSRLHTIEQMLVTLTMNLLKVDCKLIEQKHQLQETATQKEMPKQAHPQKKRWLSMSTF
jgi:hypothetical protein